MQEEIGNKKSTRANLEQRKKNFRGNKIKIQNTKEK